MKTQGIFSLHFITAFLFLSFCFSACKPKNNNDKTSILVTTWKSDAATLHPVCDPSNSGRLLIFEYTQKTLTRTDLRTLQQIPLLVKGLAEVSPNGKEFTYELRDDVKWDDGSPLTVDDVIFTLKVTKCPVTNDASSRSTYDKVKDIIKDGSNPLKFKMLAKEVYFMNKYMFNELYLIEKKHWDSSGVLDKISIPEMDVPQFDGSKYPGLAEWMKNFNDGSNGHDVKKLCGLGAYAVSEWKPGANITLTRKKNWWGENDTSAYSHAYPSQIVVKIIPDDQARYLGILNHSIDADVWLFTASYLKLKDNEDFNDHYYSGIRDQALINMIFINTRPDGVKHPKIFDDKNVRKAMAYLVPVDELNNTMVKGLGTRQASFIQPMFKKYYNDTLKLVPFDIEIAKQLLTKEGWLDTDGDNVRDKMINGKKEKLSVKLSYNGADPTNKEYVLIVKDAMYKAGVELVPDPVDQSLLQAKAGDHDFDLLLVGQSGNGSFPDDPELAFDTKNWANDGSNISGFGNVESDRIIEESNKAVDENSRIQLLKKLQAIIYDEQPIIYLYGVKRKIVISKKFEDPGMFTERPGVMLNNLKLK